MQVEPVSAPSGALGTNTAVSAPANGMPADSLKANPNDRCEISPEEGEGNGSIPNFSAWADPCSDSVAGPSVSQATSVNTNFATPGESRDSADSSLQLNKKEKAQSQAIVGQQTQVQESAQAGSTRRANEAQDAADQLTQSGRQLRAEKASTDDSLLSRQQRAQSGEKSLSEGQHNIENSSAQIDQIKQAGDQAQDQQSQCDANVEKIGTQLETANSQADQAKQKVDSVQQAQEAQRQREAEQAAQKKAAQESAPGHAKKGGPGKGNQDSPPPAEIKESSAPVSSGPPGQAKKEQAPQKVGEQQLAQAKAAQEAAERKKKELEQQQAQLKKQSEQKRQQVEKSRSQLSEAQMQRQKQASSLLNHKNNLQGDLDAARDLGDKNQKIKQQGGQLDTGIKELHSSRQSNADNAKAAAKNVDRLKSLQDTVSSTFQENPSQSGGPKVGPKDDRSTQVGANQTGSVRSTQGPDQADPTRQGQERGAFKTQENDDFLHVSLQDLNTGLSGQGFDQSSSGGKGQSTVSDDKSFADTALSYAAAAVASSNSSGSSDTAISSGGPGNSDFGHSHHGRGGHGNGKGRGGD